MYQNPLSEITEHLFKLLYMGSGIQAIVDYTYTLFNGNTISIQDSSYNKLAVSTQFPTNEPVILTYRQKGFLSKDILNSLKDDKVLNRLHQSRNAFFASPLSGDQYDIANVKGSWLFAPIWIHSVFAGFMTIPNENNPFPENALEIADLISHAISLELQKSDFYLKNKSLFYEAMLKDIIENRIQNEELLRERISNIGKKLDSNLFILVFRTASGNRSDADSRLNIVTQSTLRNYFPDSMSMIYEGDIVLLVSHHGLWISLEQVDEGFPDFLTGNNIIVGISNPFFYLTEAQDHYLQARIALELGKRIYPEQLIFNYEYISEFHCLESYREDNDIYSLCIPALYDIYCSGKEADIILLKTLFLYIRYMKNSARTSEELHIHKNTLFYRINRITELANLDLNNGDDIFRILLTEKVLNYGDAMNQF